MHEKKQRLGFEHEQDCLMVGIVVEVLVDATVLNNHDVTGLPIDPLSVMDVVAAPLEYVKHGTIQVAVLLSERSWCIDLNVRFNRLSDGRGLWTNDMFAVQLRPAFPWKIA
jgi:hypothetical protein